jgi:single-strand DNA-binding protein
MLNKVILIGRLTRDPELRFTPNTGTAVATFGLAVDRVGKNSGVDFINIAVWEKQAETCAQYLKKGRLVAVVGRLSVRSYEKDGQKRSFTEVVAEQVRFLSPANREGGLQGDKPPEYDETAKEVNLDDEDLPF